MSYVFNMAGGGGLSIGNAIIFADAPAGSTVTATKDAMVLTPTVWIKASNNSLMTALFSIDTSGYGTWTVTATDGTHTISKTVIVDSNEEYEVKFRYDLYVFQSGSGFVNGFSMLSGDLSYDLDKLYQSGTQGSALCISPSVDMTDYDTLYVDWEHGTSTRTPKFGIGTTVSTDYGDFDTYVQRPSGGGRGTDSIDVSGLISEYYIKAAGSYSNGTYIYNIWLV